MSPAAKRIVRRSRLSPKRRMISKRLVIIAALVIVVLLAAVSIAYVALHRTQKPTPTTQKPRSSTKNTTLSPLAQIPQSAIQPLATAPSGLHTDTGLSQTVNNWQQSHSFTASVFVQELSGSLRTASSNATASMIPASTYKIYVAYAILHGIEQGSYSLNTTTSDGNSIQTDLNNMILNSDNDAARTLGFLYGWKNINALLQSQGMNNTDLYNYVPPSTQPVGDKHTTATDLATMLTKLYAGKLLTSQNTQLLLTLMKQQHYRERIPAGVPSNTAVADKPGWLSPADGENGYIENDAGVVYGPKSTYLLVIMTNGSTTQPLATLSQQIYNYLES